MKKYTPNIAKNFMRFTERAGLITGQTKYVCTFLLMVFFSLYAKAQQQDLKSIKPTKTDSLIVITADINMDGFVDELELCLNSKEVRLCYYENNGEKGFKAPSNLGTVKVKDHIGYRITSNELKPYSTILLGTTNTRNHLLHEISLNSAALFHVRKAPKSAVSIRD